MPIEVRKPTAEEQAHMRACPIWEKEPSQFPYHYDEKETCLILEGDVTVEGAGQKVSFGRRLCGVSRGAGLHVDGEKGRPQALSVRVMRRLILCEGRLVLMGCGPDLRLEVETGRGDCLRPKRSFGLNGR